MKLHFNLFDVRLTYTHKDQNISTLLEAWSPGNPNSGAAFDHRNYSIFTRNWHDGARGKAFECVTAERVI